MAFILPYLDIVALVVVELVLAGLVFLMSDTRFRSGQREATVERAY